jgi:hypothetical protein
MPFDVECRYAECHYAECRYAECLYAECRGALRMLQLIGMVNCQVDESKFKFIVGTILTITAPL